MTLEENQLLLKAVAAKDKDLFCRILNLPPYRLQVSQRFQPVPHFIVSRALGSWTDAQTIDALTLAFEKFGYEIDEKIAMAKRL